MALLGSRGNPPARPYFPALSLVLIAHLVATGALMLAGSVIYSWPYNAGGGSMRLPLFAHFGIHLDNITRAPAAGDGIWPLYGTTIVLALFAVHLTMRRSPVILRAATCKTSKQFRSPRRRSAGT